MTSTLLESIKRILECPLCNDDMKDPVQLHCGHAYCKHCLKKIVTEGQKVQKPTLCPICRQPLTPGERNCHFTPGLIIKSVQGALSDDSRAGPSRERVMCKGHPQNEKKFACKQCKKGVCSECLVRDHWHYSPSSSRPMTIEQIKNEMEMQIKQSDKWNADKNNFDSHLSRDERDNEIAIGVVTNTQVQTEQTYNTALSKITQEKKETSDLLSQKIGRLMEDKEKLKTKRKEINEKAKLISSARSHIEGALKRKHPDEIVSAYSSHSQNFKTNLSTTPDPPLNLSADTRACKKMYFEKTFGGVVGKIDYHDSDDDEDEDEDNDNFELFF